MRSKLSMGVLTSMMASIPNGLALLDKAFPQQKPERKLTEVDFDKLMKAQDKRDRKALKRIASK